MVIATQYLWLIPVILFLMVEYKKSSAVLVFNDDGELALQLRAANDDSYPSHWDFSAGGGIDPAEDFKDCAERELREELGIEASIEFVDEGHYTYPVWASSNSREEDLIIYRTRHNGPFSPNPLEVQKIQFFKLGRIKEMLESGEKFHPAFALLWNKGVISRAADN